MKRTMLSALVAIILIVGAGLIYLEYGTNPKDKLIGTYTLSEGIQIPFTVVKEGGDYYVNVNNPYGANMRHRLVHMSPHDQLEIDKAIYGKESNSVNARMIGLKTEDNSFMIFKVDTDYEGWGKKFTTGYGCFGGPSSGVEVLVRS
jgi:hypothetical protein